MLKLEIKDRIMNINGVLWRVVEANSMDVVEAAISHAMCTGSIGATWREENEGLPGIYATVERAKQP